MKIRLVILSVLNFCLLMCFAYFEIYFPYIILPFIGFAICVFFWPEKPKRKSQNNDDGAGVVDAADALVKGGYKARENGKNGIEKGELDGDIDI